MRKCESWVFLKRVITDIPQPFLLLRGRKPHREGPRKLVVKLVEGDSGYWGVHPLRKGGLDTDSGVPPKTLAFKRWAMFKEV